MKPNSRITVKEDVLKRRKECFTPKAWNFPYRRHRTYPSVLFATPRRRASEPIPGDVAGPFPAALRRNSKHGAH